MGGIIWQLVDDLELADTSLQLARHLAAQPTFGLGLIKKALLASETNSLDAQLDLERDFSAPRPGAAMITAKGSAHFWPNGHHSSAGNRP